MKLTKMELADMAMPANQHGAATYGDWCRKEVERIGGDAKYVEQMRTVASSAGKNPAGVKVARAWCRVDRF